MSATGSSPATPPAPYGWSVSELQRIIQTERLGFPFLVWRDNGGNLQILSLAQYARLSVGRHADNDLPLSDDGEVSRTHAELERVGPEWALTDDGLSRNGTWLNEKRLAGRQRLTDRDRIRFGRTTIEYRRPAGDGVELTATATAEQAGMAAPLTDTQRRVLVALCRPFKDGGAYATPATNSQIAAEVFLGVDAVKNHLRLLFARFGLAALPQNQKRARLVETAMRTGLVSPRDFLDDS